MNYFNYGLKVELSLVKRRPYIDERRERETFLTYYCAEGWSSEMYLLSKSQELCNT